MTEVIFALIQLGMLANKVNETRLGRSEQVIPRLINNCRNKNMSDLSIIGVACWPLMERMSEAASLQVFLHAPNTIVQHIRILKNGQWSININFVIQYVDFYPIPAAWTKRCEMQQTTTVHTICTMYNCTVVDHANSRYFCLLKVVKTNVVCC